ncbi:hypothetical protein [Saccharopolyspora hattusasensis]|uniref:hypothetical protein n=1 Tax=Saccharopolyspora hattusasensis TaxID=1128679 RepID=UPI003D9881B4
MCIAFTDAPGGNQAPTRPSGDGSSGQDTAPPDEGLPSSTSRPQVGTIAHRPSSVNAVRRRIGHREGVGAGEQRGGCGDD